MTYKIKLIYCFYISNGIKSCSDTSQRACVARAFLFSILTVAQNLLFDFVTKFFVLTCKSVTQLGKGLCLGLLTHSIRSDLRPVILWHPLSTRTNTCPFLWVHIADMASSLQFYTSFATYL